MAKTPMRKCYLEQLLEKDGSFKSQVLSLVLKHEPLAELGAEDDISLADIQKSLQQEGLSFDFPTFAPDEDDKSKFMHFLTGKIPEEEKEAPAKLLPLPKIGAEETGKELLELGFKKETVAEVIKSEAIRDYTCLMIAVKKIDADQRPTLPSWKLYCLSGEVNSLKHPLAERNIKKLFAENTSKYPNDHATPNSYPLELAALSGSIETFTYLQDQLTQTYKNNIPFSYRVSQTKTVYCQFTYTENLKIT